MAGELTSEIIVLPILATPLSPGLLLAHRRKSKRSELSGRRGLGTKILLFLDHWTKRIKYWVIIAFFTYEKIWKQQGDGGGEGGGFEECLNLQIV